jgi:hypothetical protein
MRIRNTEGKNPWFLLLHNLTNFEIFESDLLLHGHVKRSVLLTGVCPGEYVAQFKFTVLLMPNGPHRITGLPFEEELYKSECSVEDAEIQVPTRSCNSLVDGTPIIHSIRSSICRNPQ